MRTGCRGVLVLVLSLIGMCVRGGETPSAPLPQRLSLDWGWRFHLGDIPFPIIQGHGATYGHAKAGSADGAAGMHYDDTAWRVVNLPHDWAVEGPFDEKANVSQGYRPRGIGWYRRLFQLDPADKGKHLELQIDGIATHATVWLNGTEVHHNFCGYTGFNIDLTPLARYGDELNVLAIRVDADAMEGWWYEGAGMYRHTWLIKRSAVHIATDGVYAQPARQQNGQWRLPVEVTLQSCSRETQAVTVQSTLYDPDGKAVVRTMPTKILVPPFAPTLYTGEALIESPRLWSLETPALYTLRTVVGRDDPAAESAVLDALATPIGFRTIRFDADKGFFLNDQPVKLQGTCNHQDHAGVGTALPDALWDFRLRRLKAMGSNACRCSHNPPPAEFLDACDRLGMLVMDENRNFNCAPEYVGQLEWMVRRDRNHPCVILWSVFNEEPMQATEAGYEMVRRMAAAVKRLDATRPITAAMNGGQNTPLNVSHAVDVVGFNYAQGSYDSYHKANPQKPMTSSEDTSAFMTRGEYTTDKKRNVIASYDDDRAPWGETHREGWAAIAERPFVAGGFVWTGFDYRGEPTPHTWPSASSFFGCMDVCGFPKTAFYLHQSQWIHDRPILHVVPHWNWAGSEGKPIRVMAVTNAASVELSLNGKALGEKPVDRYGTVSWEVPYAPGRLEAVAHKNGQAIARFTVETTGAPAALRLTADRKELAHDGRDAVPVTVDVIDDQGRAVPTANLPIEFQLAGPGAILGHGNGDPNCHEPEQGNRRSLFNGLAQVILQSDVSTGPGELRLTASAPGVKPATVTIALRAVDPVPAVKAAASKLYLEKWRKSPTTKTRPDPNVRLAGNDMNSWTNVKPGRLEKLAAGSWVLYRIDRFKPYEGQQQAGGQIVFRWLGGKAEAWLDGKLAGGKGDPAPAAFSIPLPPGNKDHTLTLLVEGQKGQGVGLGGSVVVEAK